MSLHILKKVLVAAVLSQAATSVIHALPLYTAREGRQCDSCHAYPFETDVQHAWKDPALADRKCNMSCQGCHTDPGGGGMRTVSGRYLAKSTLPIFESENRPWHDQKRNVSDLVRWITRPPPDLPPNLGALRQAEPAGAPQGGGGREDKAAKPAKFKTHQYPPGYMWYDPFVWSKPFDAETTPHIHGPEYGLYGKLNADPLFQVSGDVRFAYINTNTTTAFFPMQADLGGKFHPVKHFTAMATLGLVGRTDQFTATRPRAADEMYTIRNAYLMYHELPYQIFFRVGIFQPNFGMRQEDHTAFVRKNFEMDLSRKYSAVMGVEAGLAANYPYLTISAFTNNPGQAIGDGKQNFIINPQGWGATATAGWRDLAFGGGASFMIKRRDALYGGNLTAGSVDGYFNPGRFWIIHPLTFMGEFAFGSYGSTALTAGAAALSADRNFYASFIGIDYLILNGFNLKINHHYYNADTSAKSATTGRYGFGFEITPLTWFKILVEYRLVWLSTASAASYVNPFDNLSDKQWVIISHAYF